MLFKIYERFFHTTGGKGSNGRSAEYKDMNSVNDFVMRNESNGTTNIPMEQMYEKIEQVPYSRNKFEIDIGALELGDRIGQGSFGIVYKAIYQKSESERMTVAVKCVRHCNDETQLEALASEIKLLTLVNHPHVVNMIGATTETLKQGNLLLVLDYCPGGNLRDFLLKHGDRFVNSVERDYFSAFNLKTDTKNDDDDALRLPLISSVSAAGNNEVTNLFCLRRIYIPFFPLFRMLTIPKNSTETFYLMEIC